ncbi:glycosyltransferase [Paraburkholderia tropica]|uniref:glycosyltransferase n=1 Tax=Paraburkholderia tropica TaxID=92647 RepID=UPI002AB7927D|nr:glycosyltransferase [Paraburkholderia tropica]
MNARDCILFSTADWDEPYWTNKQHTAVELAKRGWRVLYVESVGIRAPRVASRRDWKRLWRRLWRGARSLVLGAPARAQNIWVMSPLMFPARHHWPLVRSLNRTLLRYAVNHSANAIGLKKPVVWTYHPYLLDAIATLDRGALVYHCVDDLREIPGVDVPAFNAAEERLLGEAGAVFTTAESLRERCARLNANTHYFPNVVDARHFGQAMEPGEMPPELAGIPEPRIIYHGVLSDFKVDLALLIEVARMRPDWQLVLIGQEREGQQSSLVAELATLPNVHLLGYRTYENLPAYLRGMQVGMLPTLLNDYTRSMFPMKFYEYLAAGLPVVSTPLAFTSSVNDGLEIGADAPAFVAAIERQLARGRLNAEEARRYVGDNTWDARTAKMLASIQSPRPVL